MSHYEERLQADLEGLRQRVRAVGRRVLEAHRRSVQALLQGDRALAYETILGDHAINREVLAIDAACHAFVARHLPSAGHLRFVSAVLRLNVALERIGDYAVTVCREAVQLTAPPPASFAGDIGLMAEQSRAVLAQALEAWNQGNAELARGTLGMAVQAASASDKVFHDLLREGEEGTRPLKDLFALLLIFNRLGRVVGQAKNLCEETLFAIAGETKARKVYKILFVDAADDCTTQLAVAFARKAFAEGGRFASAGWSPAAQIDPRCRAFMESRGLGSADLVPRPLASLREELSSFHVVVSFGGDLRPHVEAVPFHTVVLEWDLGPGLAGSGTEAAEEQLATKLQEVGVRIRQLMETLRGEEAV